MRQETIWRGGALGLGLVAALLGTLGWIGTVFPGSIGALPLSHSLAARSVALLTPTPVDAGRAEAARRLTMRELALSPGHPDGWLRLAEIDVLEHGRPTPAGLEALRRSYVAAPTEWRFHLARAEFAYDHWERLPPGLRAAAERELLTTQPLSGIAAPVFIAAIRDPSGAFAAKLAFLLQGVARTAEARPGPAGTPR